MKCGCAPQWLTSASEPVTAEEAVARSCPCCGAEKGRRCVGGAAGWLPQRVGRDGKALGKRVAYVDVCPARLGVQVSLEMAA